MGSIKKGISIRRGIAASKFLVPMGSAGWAIWVNRRWVQCCNDPIDVGPFLLALQLDLEGRRVTLLTTYLLQPHHGEAVFDQQLDLQFFLDDLGPKDVVFLGTDAMYHIVNTVVASHLSSDHMVLPEFANVARRWEGRKIGGAPLPEEHTRAGSTPLRQQDAGAEDPSEAAAAAPQSAAD